MEGIKEKAAVKRVIAALAEHGLTGEVHVLSDSARTAQEAASALGIEVGQIASSLIFKLPDDSPLLIITSGRHRVDTDLVAKNLGIEKLGRVDAEYVKEKSGFSIDCHTVGNTGNSEVSVGPSFAPFRDISANGYSGRGHLTIRENNLFAFEFMIHTWIPEWNRRVSINFEDNAIVTAKGVEMLYPRNEKIILVP